MTQRTVTRHAQGKLFIVGEYAVVETGHPAILVAVDREVSVTVSEPIATGVVIASDQCPHPTRLRRNNNRLVGCDEDGEHRARTDLVHVVSAIEVINDLLAERGLSVPALHVSINSRHLYEGGTKLGLGSSGAVTVAVVGAVAAYCDITLTYEARFRLALLATARISPTSSGGDLAASVWGGWLAYWAPDRAAVLAMAQHRGVDETLRALWPGFGLRRLHQPERLALQVGWTGVPASTTSLVSGLDSRDWRGSASHQTFLARSTACVRACMRALTLDDRDELLHQIRCARHVLARLDDEAGLGIFTPTLTALCDTAESVGGAAKPSGAGGGDCGIALLDAEASPDIARLQARWASAGVAALPMHVPLVEGHPS